MSCRGEKGQRGNVLDKCDCYSTYKEAWAMSWAPLRHGWLIVCSVIVTTFLGCGGNDGPQRYQREGKVTFNGQPVAKGEIIISPDRSKGATGPGTTVTYEDGAYLTRDGLGSLSGDGSRIGTSLGDDSVRRTSIRDRFSSRTIGTRLCCHGVVSGPSWHCAARQACSSPWRL